MNTERTLNERGEERKLNPFRVAIGLGVLTTILSVAALVVYRPLPSDTNFLYSAETLRCSKDATSPQKPMCSLYPQTNNFVAFDDLSKTSPGIKSNEKQIVIAGDEVLLGAYISLPPTSSIFVHALQNKSAGTSQQQGSSSAPSKPRRVIITVKIAASSTTAEFTKGASLSSTLLCELGSESLFSRECSSLTDIYRLKTDESSQFPINTTISLLSATLKETPTSTPVDLLPDLKEGDITLRFRSYYTADYFVVRMIHIIQLIIYFFMLGKLNMMKLMDFLKYRAITSSFGPLGWASIFAVIHPAMINDGIISTLRIYFEIMTYSILYGSTIYYLRYVASSKYLETKRLIPRECGLRENVILILLVLLQCFSVYFSKIDFCTQFKDVDQKGLNPLSEDGSQSASDSSKAETLQFFATIASMMMCIYYLYKIMNKSQDIPVKMLRFVYILVALTIPVVILNVSNPLLTETSQIFLNLKLVAYSSWHIFVVFYVNELDGGNGGMIDIQHEQQVAQPQDGSLPDTGRDFEDPRGQRSQEEKIQEAGPRPGDRIEAVIPSLEQVPLSQSLTASRAANINLQSTAANSQGSVRPPPVPQHLELEDINGEVDISYELESEDANTNTNFV